MRWAVVVLALVACGGEKGDETGAEAPDAAPRPTADAASDPRPDAGPRPDAAAGAWLEIGTGARRFEALEAGQEIPIIQGPQGGFHVWGAFRGEGFDGTDVQVDFELLLDGEVIAEAHYTEPELPVEDGVYDYPAVAVVYRENDQVQATSGQTMRLETHVTAGDGAVLTDAIEVVPLCCEF